MPLKDGSQTAFCAHKDRHSVRFFQEHRPR